MSVSWDFRRRPNETEDGARGKRRDMDGKPEGGFRGKKTSLATQYFLNSGCASSRVYNKLLGWLQRLVRSLRACHIIQSCCHRDHAHKRTSRRPAASFLPGNRGPPEHGVHPLRAPEESGKRSAVRYLGALARTARAAERLVETTLAAARATTKATRAHRGKMRSTVQDPGLRTQSRECLALECRSCDLLRV